MFSYIKNYRIPLVIALLCAIFYGSFAYDLLRSDFIKLISLYTALFVFTYYLIKIFGWNFWLLAGMGIVFRLLFLPAIPNLSQDFYRFLWDGQLISQAVNPYIFTPEMYISEPANFPGVEIARATELYAGMGQLNGSHFSNYPPVNQLFFAIAGFFTGKSLIASVIVLRLIVILADIGILYFGKKLLEHFKLPVHRIFWFFLNPFIIIELSGNLHFEGVMLFFLIWSMYLLIQKKWLFSAVLLGLSISVKLIPLIFLPLYYQYFVDKGLFSKGFWKLKKFYWMVLATVIVSFLPFYSSEFARNFLKTISLWFQDFEFNASVFYVIRWIGFQVNGWDPIQTVGKILPLVVIAFVLSISYFRRNNTGQQLITGMLFAISFYFLLSTTVHPWYVATPLLLCLFTKYKFPILWSGLVFLSYMAYGAEGYSENMWLVATEYILLLSFAIWEITRSYQTRLSAT